MKTLFIAILLFMLNGCLPQEDIYKINYEAVTRGNSIEINTNLDSISFKNFNTLKKLKLNKKSKTELKKILSEINVLQLKNIKPTSSKSFTDRKLQATLKVIKGKETYVTQTFDHGNPPREIKALIDMLLKIVK